MRTYFYKVILVPLLYSLLYASDWTLIGFEGKTITCLAVNPVNSQKLFVGVKAEGMYLSSDGGITWEQKYQTTDNISSLAIDRFNISTIYAGYKDGLLVSTSDGNRFKEVVIEKNINVSSIVLDETQTKAIIVGTGKGTYKSLDQANSFQASGLQNFSVTCLALDNSSQKAIIYAGTSNAGIFKTANYGTSWSPCNNGLTNVQICSLICDSKKPSQLYAGIVEENVYSSTNSGEAWINIPIDTKNKQSFIIAQAIDTIANSSVIFLTSFRGDVYSLTTNGTEVHSLYESENTLSGTCLGVSTIVPSVLYLGTTQGLYKMEH